MHTFYTVIYNTQCPVSFDILDVRDSVKKKSSWITNLDDNFLSFTVVTFVYKSSLYIFLHTILASFINNI